MKIGKLLPLLSALLGIMIAVMPQFFVCEHCMAMGMKCAMSSKVEMAIGLMILALAVLSFLYQSSDVKVGLHISLLFFGLLSALVSTILIGFCNGSCGMAECHCNPLTTILMVAMSVLVMINSMIQAFVLTTKD